MPIIGIGPRWGAVPATTQAGFRAGFGWLRFMGAVTGTPPPTNRLPRGGHGRKQRASQFEKVQAWWDRYEDAIERAERIRDEGRREAVTEALDRVADAITAFDRAGAPEAAESRFLVLSKALSAAANARGASQALEAANRAERQAQSALTMLAELKSDILIEDENAAILLLLS